jgi:hypothetical protein
MGCSVSTGDDVFGHNSVGEGDFLGFKMGAPLVRCSGPCDALYDDFDFRDQSEAITNDGSCQK